jgi:hypothetical protein
MPTSPVVRSGQGPPPPARGAPSVSPDAGGGFALAESGAAFRLGLHSPYTGVANHGQILLRACLQIARQVSCRLQQARGASSLTREDRRASCLTREDVSSVRSLPLGRRSHTGAPFGADEMSTSCWGVGSDVAAKDGQL